MVAASFSQKNGRVMALRVEPGAVAADRPGGGIRLATPELDPGGTEKKGELAGRRWAGGNVGNEGTNRGRQTNGYPHLWWGSVKWRGSGGDRGGAVAARGLAASPCVHASGD